MSPTPTDRFGLNGYDEDERWKEVGTTAFNGDPDGHNDTVALFDELGIDRGSVSERPASGEYDDEMFYAVDQNTLWRWDETATDWEAAAGLGADGESIPGTSFYETVRTTIGLENEAGDYSEGTETIASASGTITVDLAAGNLYRIEAIDNITIEFANVSTDPAGNSVNIYVVDDDGEGPYTISWPESVVWSDGNVVDEVGESDNVEVGLITGDGGSTWRGRESGVSFE